MKTLNVAALVAVAALAATGFSQGRPPMPPQGGMGGPPRGGFGGGGRRDPKEIAERQTQMMTPMLGLTADQQKRIRSIIYGYAVQANKLREAQRAAIMKALTADQRKKYASLRGPGGGMGRGPGMRMGG